MEIVNEHAATTQVQEIVEFDYLLLEKLLALSTNFNRYSIGAKDLETSLSMFRLSQTDWYENRHRILYCTLPNGVWLNDHHQSIVEVLVRIDENSEDPKAYVALRLHETNEIDVYEIPKDHMLTLEQDILGTPLGLVNDSIAKRLSVEVYIPPASKAKYRKDSWWSSKYLKLNRRRKNCVEHRESKKSISSSSSYMHYRKHIDDLILHVANELIDNLNNKNVHNMPKAIENVKLNIAELCSGDGSFALKLLTELGDESISSYTLFERNQKLYEESVAKLKHLSRGSKRGVKLKHINVDVCSQSGESIISNELTGLSPNLWIASGSVLCGQVGDFPMAETVLKKMASTLDHNNGYIIVTGFTQSFLNPVMIDNAGLEVLHGSLPSVEAGGLESGFKRFHMFVLARKGKQVGKPCVLRNCMLP